MTLVLRHLLLTARAAILSSEEAASIRRSIDSLKTRLNIYFRGAERVRPILFGSFRRNTILPRAMDEQSDVDYMVVFPDTGHQPQTYLDRLRRFVEARYKTSEIYQSSPTIVLELNHIRFELVPAVPGYGRDDFYIPDGPARWQSTEPLAFHRLLTQRDNEASLRLRPAIRLAKYWNALNGRVYPPYQLEGWIVASRFFDCRNLRDLFFEIIDNLPTRHDAQWKADKVERAKRLVLTVRQYEEQALYHRTAAEEVKKLVP